MTRKRCPTKKKLVKKSTIAVGFGATLCKSGALVSKAQMKKVTFKPRV